MNIKEAGEKFEQWRKEQIASLIRTGHLEAAKAFEQLGSIHWMAWQSAWAISRESLVIELPYLVKDHYATTHGFNCAAESMGVARNAIHAAGVKTK